MASAPHVATTAAASVTAVAPGQDAPATSSSSAAKAPVVPPASSRCPRPAGLAREQQAIARFAERESRRIPAAFDFAGVSGLRNEAREKLARVAPRSLGQAGRIPGLTPADLMILMVHLDRGPRPVGA